MNKILRVGKSVDEALRGKDTRDTNVLAGAFAFVLFLILLLIFLVTPGRAEVVDTSLAIRAIIGEAANQGYKGMLDLASGIRNRGTLQGVYGVKAKHVDKEPQWVWDMARKAWKESKHNRTHTGTHWENIKAFGTPYWVASMKKVHSYKDHVFYKEKQ